MSFLYKGKHRRPAETVDTITDTGNLGVGSLVNEDIDPNTCTHRRTIVLAGHVVCNSGCGTDLGPVNG